MEIKDISGLSKPLTKLIQVLEDGCSWVAQPYQIKRIAKAQAKANEIMKASDFKVQLKQSLLSDMTQSLHNAREIQQRNNIADIYSLAAQELELIKEFNDEHVSPEWSAHFFDMSKDVCDEEIQVIWAKLLAQEVSQPRSIFKRTLTVLKNIEPTEAAWFTNACSYIVNNSFLPKNAIKYLRYERILSLIDCGLMNANLCYYSFELDHRYVQFKSCTLHRIETDIELSIPPIHCFSLTDAGMQIYNIVNTTTDPLFLKEFKEELEEFGLKYEIFPMK